MSITQEIFEAHLKCPTKSHLYSNGAVGTRPEFAEWEQHIHEEFKERGCQQLRSALRLGGSYRGTPSPEAIKQRRYQFIFDATAASSEMDALLHGLELTHSRSQNATHHPYMPIRFVPSEKLRAAHKLLLGFDALALSHASGKMPRIGKIVHGCQFRVVTVQLAPLVDKVRRILPSILAQAAGAVPPPVILNRHCAECEFQARCRRVAIEKDDLSLLSNITEKERRRLHEKGIFTVTQLSHTFRPRRRSASPAAKHHHALKALAVRKKQIHVLDTPPLDAPGTPVYLDVEGVPDRDFYYLIGLRAEEGGASVQYSFWADDLRGERNMWADCLRCLALIKRPRLIHYGSYETQFLKRMKARYPEVGQAELVDRLIGSALNLLPVIYAHVYFPTYSNSLKEVAGHLGFRWSVAGSSGLAAIAWRSQWEASRDVGLRQRLITYNAEDCEGTQKVAEVLSALCRPQHWENLPRRDVVDAGSLRREYPQRFGEVEFALAEFQEVNQAAYWDYQRSRVYVRSNRRLKRLSRKAPTGQPLARMRPNKITTVDQPRPAPRCRCKPPLVYKWGVLSQTVYDLRWSCGGVRRWIVRYLFPRYICWRCKATFQQYIRKPRYGAGLCAYLLYQIIEVQVPQNAVAKSVAQLFGLPLSRGVINKVKAAEAGRYQGTYEAILDRIAGGPLVHADETKVGINGRDGYVWVFTNLEEVAFVYSETREASIAHDVLRNFRGVLVSDFYSGYDSIECAQQRCLVHLIRDLNDDLRKQPFNNEIGTLAQQFAGLLKPMIDTVDRFGLKARYLRRHKDSVERFYGKLSKQDYRTEVAAGYHRRFEKNRHRLFTFLDHDGVPWNNNNAEHAIKALARLRNTIGGKSSAKGMRDYLVLLSICESCKYKGVSFLDFLRSEEVDIDAYANRRMN